MISGKPLSHPPPVAEKRELALLHALNRAAASLQQSSHSAEKVFEAFVEQATNLGLSGSIGLLDETGRQIVFRAIAYPKNILTRLEKQTNLSAAGYTVAVSQVEVYRQVTETGQGIFVADNGPIVRQIIPPAAAFLVGRVVEAFANAPAIYAPLTLKGRTAGVLTITGDGLTPEDVPAITAFANHIAVALENARLFKDLARRTEEFRNLAEGVSAATGDAFFRSVVDYLAQSLAVEYAFVGELAGPHQHRIKTIIVHARGRIADNFEYDLQDTPCHNVVGQTLCCYPKNVQALFPKDALLADMKIESYIGTPLFNSQGQALGLMAVMGCRPLETPDLAASILQIFAARTSAELERRQSETALKARAREQAALLNLSEDLVSTLDEADIYRKMLHGLHQTLGYDYLGLFLIDPATGDRLLFGSLGWPDVPEEWRIPPGHGVSERALLDGQLHYTPDVTRDPAYVPGLNSGAEIDVPIRAGAEIVGVLTVESKKPHAFGPHDFDVLNAAANQTALALQRAREHQAVKKAEARYRGLFNGMPVGLYRSTPDKKMLDANPALVQLFGFPDRETLLQTSIDDLYINPEDRRQWQTLLVTNNLVREFEVQLRRRDGSAIWVRDSARVVRDAAGNILYYEGSLEDITERKQLEAQYLQAQKMEAVGRLTGGIAHDFNNLLTAINGFASILRREIPPHDPNHRMAGQILHAGERAADLVSQLLAFSRKQIIQPEVLNCNAVVTKMSQMLRRIIGEHIELHTGLATALWAVEIDPAQLEQVIVNLAVNARDAMPHGGRLAIQTANVLLSQKFAAAHPETEAGEYVLLSVADTGTGMTEAVKARVFEPFFTTKEMGRGTGLGLATVFGIIKQNRGEIDIESEVNRGSTFKIYLPRAQTSDAAAAAEPAEPAMPAGAETILLVEDDDNVRQLAHLVLHELGYTILQAGKGDDALRLAAEHNGPINLLLTDVVMPGMNGKTLADTLARTHQPLKILYISGYSDNIVVQIEPKKPGVAFLQKPFNPAELARKVRAVLDA